MYFVHVEFIPKRKKQKKSVRKDLVPYLDSFMRMNVKYAKVCFDDDDYASASSAYGSLYSSAVRYGYPIHVTRRDGQVYLVRKDI